MTLIELLHLDRPLIFLDIETHDKVALEQAYICEIGMKTIYPDKPSKEWRSFVKPPIPISRGATDVHSITNEDVASAPPFSHYAQSLLKGFTGADFGGYNLRSFDLPVLQFEFKRCGIDWDYSSARIVDAFRLWQIAAPRTLTGAVEEFCKGRPPTSAHRALGDAIDSHDVAVGLLERYAQLPRTIQELHDLCFLNPTYIDPEGKFQWKDGEAIICFGKHSGMRLRDLQEGYLRWMVNGGFTRETKQIVIDALAGIYPEKKG